MSDEAGISAIEREAAERQEALRRLQRERGRIRPEDWRTVFRQMGDAVRALLEAPFLKGDAEAEARIAHMLRADTLEAFDERLNHLAEYVQGKLLFHQALKAAGDDSVVAPEGPIPDFTLRMATSDSRRAYAHGPSGSDFDLDATGDQPKRRGRIRL